MNTKLRRRRRELLDIPFEFDVTMDEILEDLFHPDPPIRRAEDVPGADPRRD